MKQALKIGSNGRTAKMQVLRVLYIGRDGRGRSLGYLSGLFLGKRRLRRGTGEVQRSESGDAEAGAGELQEIWGVRSAERGLCASAAPGGVAGE